MQYGAFMIVCVRCNRAEVTQHSAKQRAIKNALQHPDFSKQVGRGHERHNYLNHIIQIT